MLWLILGIAVAVAVLVLLTAYICFQKTFAAKRRKLKDGEFDVPVGKMYEPYHDAVIQWVQEVRSLPHRAYSVTSFDGLSYAVDPQRYLDTLRAFFGEV